MSVIEAADLRKVCTGRPAVDGFSFTVEEGGIFGTLGPNGAGRTTAVVCVEGLRVPDSGRVRVTGLGPRRGSTRPPAACSTRSPHANARCWPWFAKGTSSREIARELFSREATVKTHLTHLYAGLGVTDHVAAAEVAYDRGILGQPAPSSPASSPS